MKPCTKAYRDQRQAALIAQSMSRRKGVQHLPEACSACGKWHVRKVGT